MHLARGQGPSLQAAYLLALLAVGVAKGFSALATSVVAWPTVDLAAFDVFCIKTTAHPTP